MKKTIVFVLLAILLVGCAAPTPTPSAGGQTRPAITIPSQPIEVAAGETFHIVVLSNPSTGYHWEFTSEPDAAVIEFVSRDYTADEPVAPGSGGVDVFTFNAVSAGQTQVSLGSYPPDQGATEPAETLTFDIVVK